MDAVVILNQGEQYFKFDSIGDAVKFVEKQVENPEKAFNEVVDALDNDGATIGNNNYRIMDNESYLDVYGLEEDEDEDDE